MPADPNEPLLHHGWPEVEAEVTRCKYVRASGMGRMGTGMPAYYAITFTYAVDGITYDGVTSADVEVQPGDKFSIRYNPVHPDENNSLASECDRPWFRDYTYLTAALLVGLILFGLFQRYAVHR